MSRHFRSAAMNTLRQQRPVWLNPRDLRHPRHERTEPRCGRCEMRSRKDSRRYAIAAAPDPHTFRQADIRKYPRRFRPGYGGSGQRGTTLRRRRAGWPPRAATISPALHGMESAQARLQTEAVAAARSSAQKRIRRRFHRLGRGHEVRHQTAHSLPGWRRVFR